MNRRSSEWITNVSANYIVECNHAIDVILMKLDFKALFIGETLNT